MRLQRFFFALLLTATPVLAQNPVGLDPFHPPQKSLGSPLNSPALSSEVLSLLRLESKFSQAVEKGGGKAFSQWFADDAVVLNNGKPVIMGKSAIAREAQWDPKSYQLTWQPEGAQMGPSKDMGFTWGHYKGHSKDQNGQDVTVEGRYITIWKKMQDGTWKVTMDASANDAPLAGECCALPKPGDSK